MPGFLTPSQAATRIGISEQAIREHCRSGVIPAQKAGNTWIIKSEDVDNYAPAPAGRPRKPGTG